jgi:hypothetical protein
VDTRRRLPHSSSLTPSPLGKVEVGHDYQLKQVTVFRLCPHLLLILRIGHPVLFLSIASELQVKYKVFRRQTRSLRGFLVFAAHGLIKRDFTRLPDPFVIVAVDSEGEKKSKVIERSLSPSWNEHFDVWVKFTGFALNERWINLLSIAPFELRLSYLFEFMITTDLISKTKVSWAALVYREEMLQNMLMLEKVHCTISPPTALLMNLISISCQGLTSVKEYSRRPGQITFFFRSHHGLPPSDR